MSKYDSVFAKALEEAKQEVEKKSVKQEATPQPKSSNKSACKYCGKEISLKGLYQHEKHCPENPINITKQEMDAKKELEPGQIFNAADNCITPEKLNLNPIIPLSLCSRDIGYVKENKPFYMKVVGRKVGDKVYVEEVSLMKL